MEVTGSLTEHENLKEINVYFTITLISKVRIANIAALYTSCLSSSPSSSYFCSSYCG
jgi:hypothetical protein